MTAVGPEALYRQVMAECRRHEARMCHALGQISAILPLDAARVVNMNDDQIQATDQFILRFTKLQDTMGNRLFPAVLALLGEPYEAWPMIDRLARLEKLRIVGSADDWQKMREIRNRLAHEYPDDPARTAAVLNLAVSSVNDIRNQLATVEGFVRSHQGKGPWGG